MREDISDAGPSDVYTVAEFCRRNRICRATLYNLVRRAKGPRLMKVGSRTLISVEAAADWRRTMEQAGKPGSEAAK
jgi:hypothetical protein